MLFFRDSGVCPVLKYSCIIYTLRFSALASCVALSPASMQSYARCSDAHGCANAAKTWMSKSGLALTKNNLFLKSPSMHKVNFFLSRLFLLHLLISSTALANETNEINITDAWISEAPPTVSVLAAYAKIQNKSTATKILSSVTSPSFSSIEIHLSKVTDGMARMEKQTFLTIPAVSSIELSPGNYHLMLFNPETQLKAGDNATITFNFSDGSSKSVQAPVEKRNIAGHDHHNH